MNTRNLLDLSNNKLINCPECGNLFRSNGKTKYCSPPCKEARKKKEEARKKENGKLKGQARACQVCGEIFTPVTWNQVRCTGCKAKVKPYDGYLKDLVWTCQVCGKGFTPVSVNQLRCPDCKHAVVYKDDDTRRGRFLILNRDDFRCIYCGKSSIEDKAELHVDHIVPRKKGGISKAVNLVTACRQCNLEKGAMVLSEENKMRIIEVIRQRNRQAGISDNKLIKVPAN